MQNFQIKKTKVITVAAKFAKSKRGGECDEFPPAVQPQQDLYKKYDNESVLMKGDVMQGSQALQQVLDKFKNIFLQDNSHYLKDLQRVSDQQVNVDASVIVRDFEAFLLTYNKVFNPLKKILMFIDFFEKVIDALRNQHNKTDIQKMMNFFTQECRLWMVCHTQLIPDELKQMHMLRSVERISYPEVLMAFEVEIAKNKENMMIMSKNFDKRVEEMNREKTDLTSKNMLIGQQTDFIEKLKHDVQVRDKQVAELSKLQTIDKTELANKLSACEKRLEELEREKSEMQGEIVRLKSKEESANRRSR